jgi:hypothetical protein
MQLGGKWLRSRFLDRKKIEQTRPSDCMVTAEAKRRWMNPERIQSSSPALPRSAPKRSEGGTQERRWVLDPMGFEQLCKSCINHPAPD